MDYGMKLFFSPTSPYARKVRIVLRETGQLETVEETPANALAEGAADMIGNPLSKVPSLLRDDGSTLFDSPVICEWLAAQAPDCELIPADGEARWSCLRRQALGDGVLDAAFSSVMETKRADAEQSAHWMTRWRNAILRSVAEMEKDVAGAGDRFDLGDITYACALGYLNFRLSDIDWAAMYPGLADWYQARAARSSMVETQPPVG
tara:strand:+ start:5913 stop:6530 length:618 start_codon:yes stop_codon:yes gene_type:complete